MVKYLKALKREVVTLYLCLSHPRTPWYARVWTMGVVGYALSPLDLIPDFIPVLGFVDDVLLLPLGIWLALKLIPREIAAECREAADHSQRLPANWLMGGLVIATWVAGVALAVWWLTAR